MITDDGAASVQSFTVSDISFDALIGVSIVFTNFPSNSNMLLELHTTSFVEAKRKEY